MWSAWFVVGFLMLLTKRYLKKFWFVMHYLHALLGWFTFAVTIAFVIKVSNWDPFASVHNAFGTLSVLVTIGGQFSGVFTIITMKDYNGDKPWTEKERV